MELNSRVKVQRHLQNQTMSATRNITREAERQVYARFRPSNVEANTRFSTGSDDAGCHVVRLVERATEPGIYDVEKGAELLHADTLSAYDVASFQQRHGEGAVLQPLGPLGSAQALKHACRVFKEDPDIEPAMLMQQFAEQAKATPAANDRSNEVVQDVDNSRRVTR
jgi:hypothetical protein